MYLKKLALLVQAGEHVVFFGLCVYGLVTGCVHTAYVLAGVCVRPFLQS